MGHTITSALGPLSLAGGIGATAMGNPSVGLPLMASGFSSMSNSGIPQQGASQPQSAMSQIGHMGSSLMPAAQAAMGIPQQPQQPIPQAQFTPKQGTATQMGQMGMPQGAGPQAVGMASGPYSSPNMPQPPMRMPYSNPAMGIV